MIDTEHEDGGDHYSYSGSGSWSSSSGGYTYTGTQTESGGDDNVYDYSSTDDFGGGSCSGSGSESGSSHADYSYSGSWSSSSGGTTHSRSVSGFTSQKSSYDTKRYYTYVEATHATTGTKYDNETTSHYDQNGNWVTTGSDSTTTFATGDTTQSMWWASTSASGSPPLPGYPQYDHYDDYDDEDTQTLTYNANGTTSPSSNGTFHVTGHYNDSSRSPSSGSYDYDESDGINYIGYYAGAYCGSTPDYSTYSSMSLSSLSSQNSGDGISLGGIDSTLGGVVSTVGGVVSTVSDAAANSAYHCVYDPLGRIVIADDANGNVTAFTYDDAGNLTSLTDPDGNTTSWTYESGQWSVASGQSESPLPLGEGQGEGVPFYRVTSETNALGDTRHYAYDDAGNLTRYVNYDGEVRDYQYDADGNVTVETWYGAGSGLWSVDSGQSDPIPSSQSLIPPSNTIYYSYDSAGRMLSETDDTSSIVYVYNDAGLVTSVTTDSNLLPTVTLNYQYDLYLHCTQTAATIDGTADYVDDYSYDAAGNLESISRHGAVGGNAVAAVDVAITYNEAGQIATINRYLDGDLTVTATYSYESLGLLTGLVYSQGDTVLASYAFEGIVTSAAATSSPAPSPTSPNAMLPQHDTTGIVAAILSGGYTASALLTSVTSSDGTATYTYDAIGQLLSASYAAGATAGSTSSVYVTGTDNRLISDGTYTYTYDAEGNRTAKFIDANSDGILDSGDTDITQYEWDARNRLVEVTNYDIAGVQATQVVDYLYDVENRWIGETIDSNGDGQIDHLLGFVYDGDQVVLQFEKSPLPVGEGQGEGVLSMADLSHRYLWQPNAVDQLMADEQLLPSPNGRGAGGEGGEGQGEGSYNLSTPGTVVLPLSDQQGTIKDLAIYDDGTGTTSIVTHRIYDAYGNLKSQTGAVDCLFGYTGRAFDQATGLQNNLNRWYDAKVGRWASEDPLGFNGKDANVSRYVGNSPTNATDPSGNITCKRVFPKKPLYPPVALWQIKNETKHDSEIVLVQKVTATIETKDVSLTITYYEVIKVIPAQTLSGLQTTYRGVIPSHDDEFAPATIAGFKTGHVTIEGEVRAFAYSDDTKTEIEGWGTGQVFSNGPFRMTAGTLKSSEMASCWATAIQVEDSAKHKAKFFWNNVTLTEQKIKPFPDRAKTTTPPKPN